MRWQNVLVLTTATAIFPISEVSISATSRLSGVVNNESQVQLTTAEAETVKTHHKPSPDILRQLNLTSAQKKQIELIRRQYQKPIAKRKNDLKSLQSQLVEMMASNHSVGMIRSKNHELMKLRQEIGNLRFESMLATREVLTLPQRQKFRAIVIQSRENNRKNQEKNR